MQTKGLRKGAWSEAEDLLLRRCIETYGQGKWHLVPNRAGLNRCRKSCRLRWLNYLNPDINRREFREDEVDLIIRMHRLLGNRWSLIAGRIPGRTANAIKNYWKSHLSKKHDTYHRQFTRKIEVIKPQARYFTGKLIPHQLHPQEEVMRNNLPPAEEHNRWNHLPVENGKYLFQRQEGILSNSDIGSTVGDKDTESVTFDCSGTGIQWSDLLSMKTWLLDD